MSCLCVFVDTDANWFAVSGPLFMNACLKLDFLGQILLPLYLETHTSRLVNAGSSSY